LAALRAKYDVQQHVGQRLCHDDKRR
jgi:hypothetical protein